MSKWIIKYEDEEQIGYMKKIDTTDNYEVILTCDSDSALKFDSEFSAKAILEDTGFMHAMSEDFRKKLSIVACLDGKKTPEAGAVLKCLVCAHDGPWGVFDSITGAVVCMDCRDARHLLRAKDSQLRLAHEHIQNLQVTNGDLTDRLLVKDDRIRELEATIEHFKLQATGECFHSLTKNDCLGCVKRNLDFSYVCIILLEKVREAAEVEVNKRYPSWTPIVDALSVLRESEKGETV
jgi:hypothetical protein